jgi:hypothetical protein
METETRKLKTRKNNTTKSKNHKTGIKLKTRKDQEEINILPIANRSSTVNNAKLENLKSSTSITPKEAFEILLTERERNCKKFIEMAGSSTNAPILPNIDQAKRLSDNYNSLPESRKVTTNNLLIKKKNYKKKSGNSSEKRERVDRMLSIESHTKNLQFLKKLTEKVEIAKTAVSAIIDNERNHAEKNKLLKAHYTKPEKKDNKGDTKITYYYSIIPGNNSQLVKNSIAFRENWKEDHTYYNFRWQQSSVGIDFNLFNKYGSYKQVIALF